MHDVPEKNAAILAPVAPIVAAALRNVGGIAQWSRVKRLERLEAYYKGRQYDDRPYDWDGSLASGDPLENPVGIPVPAEHYVPVAQRRPPVNYRLGRKIVQARTDLVFTGGDPEIRVDGDPSTADWMRAAAKVGQLWRRMKAARNLTGGMSESFLVYGIRAGRPFVEVLEACDVHVLAWSDQDDRVPAHVLRIWKSNDLEINPREQTLEEVCRWYAQEWFAPLTPDDLAELDAKVLTGLEPPRGTERLLRYLPKDAAGPSRWELVTETPLWEMPVVPMTNVDADDGASEGDFEGLEGLIDEANAVLCATSGGTKRNVDPTLVIKEDPIKNPGEVGKGGQNTIWSEGGAEYLQLMSDGVKAGIDTFNRLKQLGLDQAAVTEFDPEKMSGAAQSGEALRRLLQPFIAVADAIRAFSVSPVAVKVLRGWWRAAIRIERRPAEPVTVLASDGGPSSVVMRKEVVRLPPKIETGEDGEATGEKEELVPGKGGDVQIAWPDYVSLTSQDKLQLVQLLAQLVGGKPLATLRTVVTALKASKIVQIDDVDEEVEGLLVDQERNAAAQAATLGDVAPFGKGKTPPPKGAPGKGPPKGPPAKAKEDA